MKLKLLLAFALVSFSYSGVKVKTVPRKLDGTKKNGNVSKTSGTTGKNVGAKTTVQSNSNIKR